MVFWNQALVVDSSRHITKPIIGDTLIRLVRQILDENHQTWTQEDSASSGAKSAGKAQPDKVRTLSFLTVPYRPDSFFPDHSCERQDHHSWCGIPNKAPPAEYAGVPRH